MILMRFVYKKQGVTKNQLIGFLVTLFVFSAMVFKSMI